jgi:succinate-semialdehyde dehydrogenase / glutarate-semialdehyde dehydrogenase
MKYQSINPYSSELIEEFERISEEALSLKLEHAANTFKSWRAVHFNKRAELMREAARVLRDGKNKYGVTITNEMGKPLKEAIAEVEKCAWACEFYAEKTPDFLADERIASDADKSFVRYDPIGTVLAIMPWNFPFWQVFRFAAPALMAGNVCLLKHAPNVFRCAIHIEEIFVKAGFPEGAFQSLIIDIDQVNTIINHRIIKAVTLTGSEAAGASVAALAGRNIKKTVLELGGSNAFVVLKDADLDAAVSIGVQARMMNSGQSCIAAKRFILVKEIADQFIDKFKQKINALKAGDPFDEATDVGPLARKDLADKLEAQVNRSIQLGAKVITGATRKGNIFFPTILAEVAPGSPSFDEELFGPVAAVTVAQSEDEALELANHSSFGLGISVFTKSSGSAQKFIEKSEDGAVFINGLVKSDPRLPFGGTKHSGYGRELSSHGIKEFVNIKTVHIKDLSD